MDPPAPDDRWLRLVALPIVRRVAGTLARGPWEADFDDLIQEGMLAIWRENITDPRLVGVCARRRMIDAQRRAYGRGGSVAAAGRSREWSLDVPVTADGTVRLADSLGRPDPGFAHVEADIMLRTLNDPEAGFSDREREILRRQAAGELLREIGASWGVTESRACQVSMKARRKLSRAVHGLPEDN